MAEEKSSDQKSGGKRSDDGRKPSSGQFIDPFQPFRVGGGRFNEIRRSPYFKGISIDITSFGDIQTTFKIQSDVEGSEIEILPPNEALNRVRELEERPEVVSARKEKKEQKEREHAKKEDDNLISMLPKRCHDRFMSVYAQKARERLPEVQGRDLIVRIAELSSLRKDQLPEIRAVMIKILTADPVAYSMIICGNERFRWFRNNVEIPGFRNSSQFTRVFSEERENYEEEAKRTRGSQREISEPPARA